MNYPEQIPNSLNAVYDNFKFSFSMVNDTFKELQEHHSNLDARISQIVDSEKFFINGFPVLKNILMLSPKKNDLKKLSKALDRLADLVEAFDSLESKINLIETVRQDPHWFAGAFGDFSSEIPNDINIISD